MKNTWAIIAGCLLFILKSAPLSLGLVDHSSYKGISVCLDCHPRALPTHKRGMPQQMTEPLPLDEQGRMLCITCHDCLSGTCLLRRDSAQQLCIICHDCSRGMACILGVAHMGNSPNLEYYAINGCLSCHDGATASMILDHEGHPIDIIHIPGRTKQLKQIVDRRVILINGKVTCLSCHNPYGSDEAYLSRSNEGSSLCLACHLK